MSKTPLSNRKLEIVAPQLAKGATAAEASIAAGYRTNGAAFAANCRQRANYPEAGPARSMPLGSVFGWISDCP